jgi:hypothetical protein
MLSVSLCTPRTILRWCTSPRDCAGGSAAIPCGLSLQIWQPAAMSTPMASSFPRHRSPQCWAPKTGSNGFLLRGLQVRILLGSPIKVFVKQRLSAIPVCSFVKIRAAKCSKRKQAKSICYNWLRIVPSSTEAARRFRYLFSLQTASRKAKELAHTEQGKYF